VGETVTVTAYLASDGSNRGNARGNITLADGRQVMAGDAGRSNQEISDEQACVRALAASAALVSAAGTLRRSTFAQGRGQAPAKPSGPAPRLANGKPDFSAC
jgi:hypothetical protein